MDMVGSLWAKGSKSTIDQWQEVKYESRDSRGIKEMNEVGENYLIKTKDLKMLQTVEIENYSSNSYD